MTAKGYREALFEVHDAILRGRGRFALGVLPDTGKVGLTVGSANMIRVKGGFLISIALDEDHIRELRESCDAALAALGAS